MPTDYVSNRYMSKLGMPAQQVTWDDDLDFDEVAKFFAMPVNDAANILGVCVSTLKRICKDNGLSRWPYRKFVAGRTVEEIKREAALAKSLAEQQQQYSSNHVSNSGHYAQASSSYSSHHHHYQQQQQQQQQMQHHHHHQYSSQVQSRPIHKGRFSTTATYRTKMPIPCFLDEFRYGHPPQASMEISKWWGVSDEGEGKGEVEGEGEGKGEGEGEGISVAKKLVMLRVKKAEKMRKSVRCCPIAKGFSGASVDAKKLAALEFIFGSEQMPQQWKYTLT